MSGYVIESGVPIPPRPRGGAPRKYPIDQLKVGESVVLPKKAAWAIAKEKTRTKREYTHRTLPDGRIRVWRTA